MARVLWALTLSDFSASLEQRPASGWRVLPRLFAAGTPREGASLPRALWALRPSSGPRTDIGRRGGSRHGWLCSGDAPRATLLCSACGRPASALVCRRVPSLSAADSSWMPGSAAVAAVPCFLDRLRCWLGTSSNRHSPRLSPASSSVFLCRGVLGFVT